MSRHFHYRGGAMGGPESEFCEGCGARWQDVLDGRAGRARRRALKPPQTVVLKSEWRIINDLAWVAKQAVTLFHAANGHSGQWTNCDYGPCGEMRRLHLTQVIAAATP